MKLKRYKDFINEESEWDKNVDLKQVVKGKSLQELKNLVDEKASSGNIMSIKTLVSALDEKYPGFSDLMSTIQYMYDEDPKTSHEAMELASYMLDYTK